MSHVVTNHLITQTKNRTLEGLGAAGGDPFIVNISHLHLLSYQIISHVVTNNLITQTKNRTLAGLGAARGDPFIVNISHLQCLT